MFWGTEKDRALGWVVGWIIIMMDSEVSWAENE